MLCQFRVRACADRTRATGDRVRRRLLERAIDAALRANDGETSESLKFSLEGEGQPSWSCNTRKLIPTVLPGLVVTEDRASCRPRRRRRPRCRIGLVVGLLQRRRSCVFWPRRTARPALAGSEQSYGGKVCTRRR